MVLCIPVTDSCCCIGLAGIRYSKRREKQSRHSRCYGYRHSGIDYPRRCNCLKIGEPQSKYQPKGVERSHVCGHAHREFLFCKFGCKDAVVPCGYSVFACNTSWCSKKHCQCERYLNIIFNNINIKKL